MLRILLLVSLLALCGSSGAQVPATMSDQMSTEDHLKQPGWWPRKGDASRSDYVGPGKCAQCHKSLAASQNRHSMAHTSARAEDSDVLKQSDVEFKTGTYTYRITRKDHQEIYSVTDGTRNFSTPLVWAFGGGRRGQTYIYGQDRHMYESRISFIRGLGFAITPGQPEVVPDFATGRPIPETDQVLCFGCHTTASRSNGHFDPSQLMQGISCEGCHGPGAGHVSLAESGSETPGLIFNPSHLSASQSVDFCGACHRTWWDVVGKYTDVGAIRFPAYRLEGSRCWGEGDARLTCIACHDPHQPLVQDSAAYDDKCLACHQSRKETQNSSTRTVAPRCPVGTSACATCHLPKYEIPGMHLTFTDHKIRIVHGKEFQE